MKLGWLKWLILILIAVPVALVAAGYLILTSWDFDELRQIAQQEVRKATGRELRIEGPIDIAFSLTPAITLEDIHLSNMPGGSAEEMARIEHLEVQVALLPLLQRQLEVQHFLLQGAEILLETDAEGRPNWAFGEDTLAGQEEGKASEGAGKAGRQDGQQPPRLQNVTIENARLTWRNGQTGDAMTVALEQATIKELQEHLELAARGDYQGMAFATEGRLGTPQELLGGSDFPLDLSGHLAQTRYSLRGKLSDLQGEPGADLQISLEGSDLPAFSRLAGRDLPDVGAYSLKGGLAYSGETVRFQDMDIALGESRLGITGEVKGLRAGTPVIHASLRGEGAALEQLAALAGAELQPLGAWRLESQLDASIDRLSLTDMTVRLGQNALAGNLQVALGGPRPAISGRLESDFLDLTALLPEERESQGGSGGGKSQESSPFVIPDTPLPLEALHSADADLEVILGGLRLPNDLELDELDMKLQLAGGNLSLEPRRLGFYDGNLAGAIRIDASQEPAALSTNLQLSNLDIGRLMREREITDAMRGQLNARLQLSGRGNSPRRIASSLNGESELEVGDGVISNRLLAIIGSGLNEIMNPLFGGQDTTGLNCVLSRIEFQEGIAIHRAAVIDTDTFSVAGSGRINLRDESLDLHFDTSSRVPALVSLAIPFNVRGTLKNPQFAPDPLGTAQRAAELIGVDISPAAALTAMMGMSSEEAKASNPCIQATEAAPQARETKPQEQLQELGRGLLEEGLSRGLGKEGAEPAEEIGRRLRGLFGK